MDKPSISHLPHSEQVIRTSIWNWPTLYGAAELKTGDPVGRTSVLHHLFCVIGNGYEWVSGRLECEDYQMVNGEAEWFTNTTLMKPHAELVQQEHEDYEKKKIRYADMQETYERIGQPNFLADQRDKYIATIEYTHANLEDFATHTAPMTSVYPMCEYSALACIPDDVQDDYLDVCEEGAHAVLRDIETCGYEEWDEAGTTRVKSAHDAEAVAKCKEICEAALVRIAELRAARAEG